MIFSCTISYIRIIYYKCTYENAASNFIPPKIYLFSRNTTLMPFRLRKKIFKCIYGTLFIHNSNKNIYKRTFIVDILRREAFCIFFMHRWHYCYWNAKNLVFSGYDFACVRVSVKCISMFSILFLYNSDENKCKRIFIVKWFWDSKHFCIFFNACLKILLTAFEMPSIKISEH